MYLLLITLLLFVVNYIIWCGALYLRRIYYKIRLANIRNIFIWWNDLTVLYIVLKINHSDFSEDKDCGPACRADGVALNIFWARILYL
jgi:hypothetical protein